MNIEIYELAHALIRLLLLGEFLCNLSSLYLDGEPIILNRLEKKKKIKTLSFLSETFNLLKKLAVCPILLFFHFP